MSFRETMASLQAEGDRIAGVMESMERNQANQQQFMLQFMTTFLQQMKSQGK